MATLHDLARDTKNATAAVTSSAYKRGLTAWRRVEPGHIAASWQMHMPSAVAAITAAQLSAATDAQAWTLTAMELQDLDATGPLIDPRALAGTMPRTGALVQSALAGVAFHALDRIAEGMSPRRAMLAGELELGRLTQVAVADAFREAEAGMIGSRQQSMGWVRMAHANCCARCAVLAGRFYRWNDGFERHLNCRCVHVATTQSAAQGLIMDPYDHFEGLSPAEQDRRYTKAGAAAIREGADIYQVVNAHMRQGALTPSRRFTREGTRSGYFRTSTAAGRAGQRRLTVSEIQRRARGSRTAYRELLEQHGYLLPTGQVRGGAIIGPREGWGQYGRGGRAVGARWEIERARATGVRSGSLATMTAAELRAVRAAQAEALARKNRLNPRARQTLNSQEMRQVFQAAGIRYGLPPRAGIPVAGAAAPGTIAPAPRVQAPGRSVPRPGGSRVQPITPPAAAGAAAGAAGRGGAGAGGGGRGVVTASGFPDDPFDPYERVAFSDGTQLPWERRRFPRTVTAADVAHVIEEHGRGRSGDKTPLPAWGDSEDVARHLNRILDQVYRDPRGPRFRRGAVELHTEYQGRVYRVVLNDGEFPSIRTIHPLREHINPMTYLWR